MDSKPSFDSMGPKYCHSQIEVELNTVLSLTGQAQTYRSRTEHSTVPYWAVTNIQR